MKKTMNNYEAPVAEMIEMQPSTILTQSGGGEEPGDGGGPGSSDGTGGGVGGSDTPDL